ncbi:hypothetical protein [Aquabacterium sp. NJ1]|uniref:hypothetical protein n=1 Tax=Aquabacterium sp. NJ1 TaxID=1538295 RepID=UPI00126A34F2|nr:hypothetical protein [Aquabacterium sp. NJ1]
MSTLERKAFWRAYIAWLTKASVVDEEALHVALACLCHFEVRPIISAIAQALKDEATKALLPVGLVNEIEALQTA